MMSAWVTSLSSPSVQAKVSTLVAQSLPRQSRLRSRPSSLPTKRRVSSAGANSAACTQRRNRGRVMASFRRSSAYCTDRVSLGFGMTWLGGFGQEIGGRACGGACGIGSVVAGGVIGVDDARHQRVADHVGAGEAREGDATHIVQHRDGIDQAALLSVVQVDLGDVAGDDGLAAEADAGEEHLHLFRRGVLRLVEDDEGVVQRASAHVGQRRDLDGLLFEELLGAVEAQQVVQGVIERAQVGIDLLRQVAWQEAQAFASFHGRAREHDALHGVALQRIDRAGYRQVGLAGTGGADAEGDVVLQDGIEVLALVRRAAAQVMLARLQYRAVGWQGILALPGVDDGGGRCGRRRRRSRLATARRQGRQAGFFVGGGMGALFDQGQLDIVHGDGAVGHGIEALQHFHCALGIGTGDHEAVAPAEDGHVQRRRDLAQVFIERAAQVGQAPVVQRLGREVVRLVGDLFQCRIPGSGFGIRSQCWVTISPRSENGKASRMLTSTNWPIRRWPWGPPSKLTTRLFSVRPCSSWSRRLETPSTRMRCTLPTMAALILAALSLMAACKRCSRCSLISGGVSSGRLAAGVPGRALKMKEKLLSKPTSSTSLSRAWKSSSVSPGKPTMKSDCTVISGRTLRMRRITDLYSSAVQPRFMAASVRSDPCWAGRQR
eukprot:TRINITY_DN959_c0_g7_i1.p1 TRINITY_DN959_c0_g7~~TRINITY_DN959_c0_g7_i1.p1  ORF type:complete len:661 (+),score=231.75 TRINITY_DN959_c0_g7_i1:1723-3705(+)